MSDTELLQRAMQGEIVGDGTRQLELLASEYAKLRDAVLRIVPYVMGTIGPGCHFPSERRKDWIEIHAGRANSSYHQLQQLERIANREVSP